MNIYARIDVTGWTSRQDTDLDAYCKRIGGDMVKYSILDSTTWACLSLLGLATFQELQRRYPTAKRTDSTWTYEP